MLTYSTKRCGFEGSALLALLLAAQAGCSSIEPDETPGELGNGAFRYVCVDDDASCPSGGEASAFPEAVATSARFDVTYQLFEDGSDAEVSSASAELIAASGTGFRAERAGTAALLARRTLDSVTVDFTHLNIENPSSIDVETSSGSPIELSMQIGERQQLIAVPLDAVDSPLAGALSFEWQSSDPNVLQLELGSGSSRMTIAALASGSATLTVQSGELTRSFAVVVP